MTTYVEVSEIKEAIGKSLSGDDTVLQLLATAASRAIDAVCNRPDGFVALSTAAARLYAGSGKPWLRIDECAAITQVAVKASPTDSSYTVWSTSDWIAFRGDAKRPTFGITPYDAIMVAPGGDYGAFLDGYATHGVPMVQVTAKWGYALTCPPAIRQAALIQVARWFKRGEAAWSDALANADAGQLMYRQAMDPDVKFILIQGRYIRPVV